MRLVQHTPVGCSPTPQHQHTPLPWHLCPAGAKRLLEATGAKEAAGAKEGKRSAGPLKVTFALKGQMKVRAAHVWGPPAWGHPPGATRQLLPLKGQQLLIATCMPLPSSAAPLPPPPPRLQLLQQPEVALGQAAAAAQLPAIHLEKTLVDVRIAVFLLDPHDRAVSGCAAEGQLPAPGGGGGAGRSAAGSQWGPQRTGCSRPAVPVPALVHR